MVARQDGDTVPAADPFGKQSVDYRVSGLVEFRVSAVSPLSLLSMNVALCGNGLACTSSRMTIIVPLSYASSHRSIGQQRFEPKHARREPEAFIIAAAPNTVH